MIFLIHSVAFYQKIVYNVRVTQKKEWIYYGRKPGRTQSKNDKGSS